LATSSGAVASISNGLLTVNYTNISFSGKESITIRACDTNGNCTDQAFEIEIGDIVTVYNAVSPNGDNKNDYLFLQYIDILPSTKTNRVTIFNRWGDEVFSVSDYDNKTKVFIGLTNDGSKLPAGTYFYKIELPLADKSLSGFFDLKY
jgi:gliding motility-associated-like protein